MHDSQSRAQAIVYLKEKLLIDDLLVKYHIGEISASTLSVCDAPEPGQSLSKKKQMMWASMQVAHVW